MLLGPLVFLGVGVVLQVVVVAVGATNVAVEGGSCYRTYLLLGPTSVVGYEGVVLQIVVVVGATGVAVWGSCYRS